VKRDPSDLRQAIGGFDTDVFGPRLAFSATTLMVRRRPSPMVVELRWDSLPAPIRDRRPDHLALATRRSSPSHTGLHRADHFPPLTAFAGSGSHSARPFVEAYAITTSATLCGLYRPRASATSHRFVIPPLLAIAQKRDRAARGPSSPAVVVALETTVRLALALVPRLAHARLAPPGVRRHRRRCGCGCQRLAASRRREVAQARLRTLASQ